MGGLALLCATSPAQAALKLHVTSSAGGDSGDVTGAGGLVSFTSAPFDSKFTLVTVTGTSKPLNGSAANAAEDTNTIDISTSGPATLTIRLTDTGFTATGPGTLSTALSASAFVAGAGSTVSGQTFKDPSNVEFGTGGFASTKLSHGTGPFAVMAADLHGNIPTTYSMTQVITVTFAGAGPAVLNLTYTSRNPSSPVVNTVPEPSTMALGGLGSLGLIGYGLRRRKALGA